MKKYNVQFYIIIFIVFALAGMSHREASAYKVKIKVEKTGPYAEKMGDEMFDVAKKAAERDIKRGLKHKRYTSKYFVGMKVTKKDTFTICKPYVYWNDKESYSLYPSYIFPIAVKGQIVVLLEVFGRMDEPEYVSANIRTNYNRYEEEIGRLNELDYLHKDYVFFYYEGIAMAHSKDGEIVKLYNNDEPDCELTDGEKFFYALDYDKKLELTIAQMDDFMTHEEFMALSEKPSDPNLIIGGTGSGKETAPAPQQTTPTPKSDTSKGANFDNDNSRSMQPARVVAGVIAVLVIIVIIVRIRKQHSK